MILREIFEAFGNGVVKVCGFKFGPQLGKVSLYGERRNRVRPSDF